MSRRLAQQIAQAASSGSDVRLLTGTVTAVAAGLADVTIDGQTIEDLSYIVAPGTADTVALLRTGRQYLIIGPISN